MSPFQWEHDEIFSSKLYTNSIFTIEDHNYNDQGGQHDERAQDGRKRRPKLSRVNMANKLMREIRQKWTEFRDNLAFDLRNKLFIMEINLKRRLRQLANFISKRLDRPPHCRPPIQPDGEAPAQSSLAPSLVSRLEEESRDCSLNSARRSIKLTEPLSVESLGVQQGHILSRLERMKRDSQKISGPDSSSPSVSPESHSLERPGQATASWHTSDASASDSSALPGGSSKSPARLVRQQQQQRQPSKLNGGNHFGNWTALSNYAKRRNKRAKVTDSSKDKKICIVCYERAPNILTLPCEHSDICSVCFIEIIYMAVKNSQYPLKCVLCRQRVERIRCSRRLMLSVVKQERRCKSESGRCNLFSF